MRLPRRPRRFGRGRTRSGAVLVTPPSVRTAEACPAAADPGNGQRHLKCYARRSPLRVVPTFTGGDRGRAARHRRRVDGDLRAAGRTTGEPALHLPLVQRVREPHLGRWALPGGPLRAGRVAARGGPPQPRRHDGARPRPPRAAVHVRRGRPRRAARPRVVSVVYWALVRTEEAARTRDDPHVAWFPAEDLPPLAFDHDEIVGWAVKRLKSEARVHPPVARAAARRVHPRPAAGGARGDPRPPPRPRELPAPRRGDRHRRRPRAPTRPACATARPRSTDPPHERNCSHDRPRSAPRRPRHRPRRRASRPTASTPSRSRSGKGRPRDLFWPWFAANVSVLGARATARSSSAFGISFLQATIVARRRHRRLVRALRRRRARGQARLRADDGAVSRAAFGVHGNRLARGDLVGAHRRLGDGARVARGARDLHRVRASSAANGGPVDEDRRARRRRRADRRRRRRRLHT